MSEASEAEVENLGGQPYGDLQVRRAHGEGMQALGLVAGSTGLGRTLQWLDALLLPYSYPG